jgi:PAS domain S-box-containing protein
MEQLRKQLKEANDTIEAIRRGEIDALVIKGKNGNEVYTLESADRPYRVFLEKMTEGAVTLNSQGIIQYSNSSFARMISLTPALVVAEAFEEFVSADDKQQFAELLATSWKADTKGEVGLITNTGFIPVQLSMTALRLGNDFSLSILVTDLTKQKEAQLQLKLKNDQLALSILALEVSNSDLQQFAYVASHDLQEPLRKILITSRALKVKFEGDISDTAVVVAMEKLISSATRMSVLIVDILDYSRLSRTDLNFESTDFTILIKDLLEDLQLAIDEKKAVIAIHDMPALPVFRAQIRQVFQNIISNALKFTAKGEVPRIDISSSKFLDGFALTEKNPENFCHIHIKDNGIGFEDKFSKSIFNLFEKLNSRESYEGTGIGLAVCKKIIEKHHGYITVTSKPGEGSDFILSLPLLQDH